MLKRPKFILMILLLSAGVLLLGSSQIWAAPPCETVRIFDGGEYGPIKVVFNPGTCEVEEVYFCDLSGGCTSDADWGTAATAVPDPVICTCYGTECVDDLHTNLTNSNVTVDCHEIISVGPRSSGCPILGSRTYLSPSGDAYYRR